MHEKNGEARTQINPSRKHRERTEAQSWRHLGTDKVNTQPGPAVDGNNDDKIGANVILLTDNRDQVIGALIFFMEK